MVHIFNKKKNKTNLKDKFDDTIYIYVIQPDWIMSLLHIFHAHLNAKHLRVALTENLYIYTNVHFTYSLSQHSTTCTELNNVYIMLSMLSTTMFSVTRKSCSQNHQKNQTNGTSNSDADSTIL